MAKENVKEFIDILISLEPIFKKAGKLAVDMRKTAVATKKGDTGISAIDIVTSADLAVQEFVLLEMAKTRLTECKLIAEEDTASVKKFKGTNKLTLTLDPIDGTFIYASAGRFFSIIVCLNDGKKPIYTFCYYPLLDWTRRIIEDKVEDFAKELPKVEVKDGLDLSRTITRTSRAIGQFEKEMPEVYKELLKKGYEYRRLSEITSEATSSALFYLGQVAGYYTEDPGAYDGLVILHYAQAMKLKIYSNIDISKSYPGKYGQYYPGWYLVLQK